MVTKVTLSGAWGIAMTNIHRSWGWGAVENTTAPGYSVPASLLIERVEPALNSRARPRAIHRWQNQKVSARQCNLDRDTGIPSVRVAWSSAYIDFRWSTAVGTGGTPVSQ